MFTGFWEHCDSTTHVLPLIPVHLLLKGLIEQDHRAVKRLTRPMLGFKSFWAAQNTLAGIELMHMIRKGQLQSDGGEEQTLAEQFYALAA